MGEKRTPVRRAARALTLAGVVLLASAGAALAASVSMVDDEFAPSSITVAAGESITFTNNGDRPHTATADNGAFDTGSVSPGASTTITVTEAGTYRFYCEFHGGPGGDGMAGVLTVTGAGGGGTTGGNTGGNTGGTTGGTGAVGGGTTLPQTATPLPLIGGLGAALLGAGLWIGRRRAG